jgi:hypothetical protein
VTVSPLNSAIDVEALLHHPALLVRVDAEHARVSGELTGADAEHHPTAREVVEHHDPVGEHQRVVVGERAHSRAELDVMSALRGGSDHHLGRRDRLGAGGVVLPDPGLVEAEAIEVVDQLEVTLQVEGRVRADQMHRRQEDPESKRP